MHSFSYCTGNFGGREFDSLVVVEEESYAIMFLGGHFLFTSSNTFHAGCIV